MKKILALPILAFLLSCNSGTQYVNCTETSFNFNKDAMNEVVEVKKTKGNYTINSGTETNIIGFENETILKEDLGYSVTNKMNGDTLVIQHFPTENTPSNVLKYGTEYKFYN